MNWSERYDKYYKVLLIIPFVMLLLGGAQLGYQYATTGDIIIRGISLSGGIVVTVTEVIDTNVLEAQIDAAQINVRTIEGGTIVESNAQTVEERDALLAQIDAAFGGLDDNQITVESTGAALGQDFFIQIATALLIAFLFMGIVVFFIFRTIVPSIAVILAIFSNIVVVAAIINLLGVQLSSAGIAAFLMLIGYSVDTDILLSTRVVKRRKDPLNERIWSAATTGWMMSATTFIAVTIALIMTSSDIVFQIMLILLIGLLVDWVNTWLQNAGLLRWYMEGRK